MKQKLLSSILLVVLLLSIAGTAFAQGPVPSTDVTLTKREAGLTANANGNKLQNSLSSELVTAMTQIVNSDFEQGPGVGWSEYSQHGWELVNDSSYLLVTPHSGNWGVWLGGDYDDISYIQQNISIVSPAHLRVWYWSASAETACGNDFGFVVINNAPIHTWDLCDATDTGGWRELNLDLSAYNGQTVTLKIQVETDPALNSNLFIDDVTLYQTFADVPVGYWSESYIHRLYNAGITGGCGTSPLMYCPTTNVTRDQMAIFLLRGIHSSSYTPPAATGVFGDVPTSYWAAAWIEELAKEGITAGCGSGNFCPTTAVTRDQMAIFLLRSKYGSGYVPPAATGVFTDVPLSYWAADWIEALAAEGITGGCSVTPKMYCPTTAVTRDQMAVFLVRTFNLP